MSPTSSETRNVLLDTTFLIDLMRGDEDAIAKAEELSADLVQQRVSAMTLFELEYGATRSVQSEAERDRIRSVLESKPVHPADSVVMQKAGRLSGKLEADGNAIGDGDVIIAATAEVLEEPVLTRNVDDFERIGVAVSTY